MKNLFIVFLALLILSSCKDKDKEKPAIPVTKITLEPNPATVAMGAKLKLTPTLTPGEASNKTLTWESSAPTIATVDSNGEVTGVAAGTATITATASDGSKVTGTTALTVKSNISAITLGDEKFNLSIPADGSTTITLNNASRTLSSILNNVPVNITAADGVTIKIGSEDFKQGQKVDFTRSQTFTVSAPNGATTKYTIAITAYNATTNPYGIYTVAHLNDVRNDKAGSYKLMNDLTLPALNDRSASAAIGIEDYFYRGWLPIAHDGRVSDNSETLTVTGGFTGTFDGGNFSINNLYIERATIYAGLFGVTSGAILKDLGITGTTSPITVTSKYAGALAGLISRGTITNCHVENFSISLTADNDSPNYYSSTGGLVGRSYEGIISNCYTAGSVSASAADSFYSSNTSAAATAGGLVGRSDKGTISNCYTTGSVSASFTSSYASIGIAAAAGGLVGHSYKKGTISNCYTTGNVSATSADYPSSSSDAGGLVGFGDNEISNCYATGNVSASNTAGGLVGRSDENKISNCYATGSVSASYTAGGLVGVSKKNGTINNCYATGSVSATSSSAASGGLVGLNESSTISNCHATGIIFGFYTAGGLVGSNHGNETISNCYATGNVSASFSAAGGLVGSNGDLGSKGIISNCYATGSVSATSTSDFVYAGGLVGISHKGIISNCYATGSVSASTTQRAIAGGLVGFSPNSTISNCYATGNVSSITSSDFYGFYAAVGGLLGREDVSATFRNCYRNSNAEIKKYNAPAASADASIASITAKSKKDMQTDAFTTSLNEGTTVWGRSTGKNDDLPYITGVGVGKN